MLNEENIVHVPTHTEWTVRYLDCLVFHLPVKFVVEALEFVEFLLAVGESS